MPALSERRESKGFTLVELLVVITIIAILSVIGLTIYTSTLKSARDARRLADLRDLKNALEQYYAQNQQYPVTAQGINCSFCINDIAPPNNGLCGGTRFSDKIAPYVSSLVHDPSYSVDSCGDYDQNYLYTPGSTGNDQQSYILWAHVENPSNANAPNASVGGRPPINYYTIGN